VTPHIKYTIFILISDIGNLSKYFAIFYQENCLIWSYIHGQSISCLFFQIHHRKAKGIVDCIPPNATQNNRVIHDSISNNTFQITEYK